MALTEQDIARLARLAGLRLDPSEQERARRELERILGLIAQLQAVDTTGIEPMAHPLEARQDVSLRLRDDRAAPALTLEQRAAHMANAPAQHEGLFLVPTVIE